MRSLFLLAVACVVCVALPATARQEIPPASPKTAGADHDFPLVFDFNEAHPAPGRRWANQSPIDGHSLSEWRDDAGRTGGAIYMKGSGGEPDQMRVWRKVITRPPANRELHVRAWVKGAGVRNVAFVCMQGRLRESGRPDAFATTQVETPLVGDFDWKEVRTTLNVPDGCDNVQVLLTLVGDGEVWFDDVSIELGAAVEGIAPGLFFVRGEFTVAGTTSEVTLRMPLPLLYRDQAPLTYDLDVTPPARFASARLVEVTAGNWVSDLRLKGVTPLHTDTKVVWHSIVLVAPSDFDAVPQTADLPGQWPPDLARWTAATRSAQADNERIKQIAREIRGDTSDILTIVRATCERTAAIIEAQTGNCTQLDAVQALDTRGSCTSEANLMTALLRANEIPTRILAGYPAWSGPLQTHYIVEAFVPGFGWYPIESSLFRHPWPNFQQVHVSIVPPEHENQSAPRPAAAGGVPYLSLTEHDPTHAPITTFGTIVGIHPACDHECRPLRNLPAETTREEWGSIMQGATRRWRTWLTANTEMSLGSPADAKTPEWYRTVPLEMLLKHLSPE